MALPKAFQNQTSFAFGFFVSRQLPKASFRRLWVSRTNEEVDVVDNPSEGKSNHSGDDNAQHWQSRSRYTGKC